MRMSPFPSFYIKLQLAVGVSLSLAISEQGVKPPVDSRIPGYGQPCETVCSKSTHTVCKNSTCICHHSYPVHVKGKNSCYKPILLREDCEEDAQCKYYDQNAVCKRFSRHYMECTCIDEYIVRDIHGLHPPMACFPGSHLRNKDLKTFLGLGFCLSSFSALLCLAMHMFARARFPRSRGYADAALDPPLLEHDTNSRPSISSYWSLTESERRNSKPYKYILYVNRGDSIATMTTTCESNAPSSSNASEEPEVSTSNCDRFS